jgi:hypothetical protein
MKQQQRDLNRYNPPSYKKKNRQKKKNINSGEIGRVYKWPMPHELFAVMKVRTVNGLLDAVLSGNSKVYRPTSVFDIEPDAGGPSYSGYTFFSTLYQRYRVIKYSYRCTFSNLQSDACAVGCYPIPDTSTPSELPSSSNPEIARENSMGTFALLGSVNGGEGVKTLSGTIIPRIVWGTIEAETDSSWASLIGSSPVANTWLMVTAERINGAAFSTGVQFDLEVCAHVEWHQRLNPTN